jgi:hypothetical protein
VGRKSNIGKGVSKEVVEMAVLELQPESKQLGIVEMFLDART